MGTRETLRIMRTLARKGSRSKDVLEYAATFEGLPEGVALDKLDNDVRRVFHYRGEIQELIRTPEFMMEDWKERGYLEGDCDDVSTFFASVLIALGFNCRFVAIRTAADNVSFAHVFCEAQTKGKVWIRFDATVSNETILIYYGQRMEQGV